MGALSHSFFPFFLTRAVFAQMVEFSPDLTARQSLHIDFGSCNCADRKRGMPCVPQKYFFMPFALLR
jgi:hypothetical protein